AFLQRGRRLGNGVIGSVGSDADLPVARESFEHRRLVGDLRIDYADEDNAGVLLARVVAALEQRVVEKLGIADLEPSHDRLAQELWRVVERQRQLSDAQQLRIPGRSTRQR